jgi:hypothetical protein
MRRGRLPRIPVGLFRYLGYNLFNPQDRTYQKSLEGLFDKRSLERARIGCFYRHVLYSHLLSLLMGKKSGKAYVGPHGRIVGELVSVSNR